MRASGENGIGDQMSDVSLAYILENAYGIGKISNRSITFGNQVIDPNHLDGIVYDNSEMLRVILPYKLTDKGEIVPDFDTYKEIEKVVEANKNSPESVINRYLQEVLPGTTYDKETKSVRYPEKNSHVFLTFRGVASNLLTPFTPDMNYMVKSDKNKDINIVTDLKSNDLRRHRRTDIGTKNNRNCLRKRHQSGTDKSDCHNGSRAATLQYCGSQRSGKHSENRIFGQ